MKNKNKNKIIFVSLNELNFELIENYLKNKKFINFSKIKKNLTSTTSEKNYKLLEPWIQWVSIYYGKSAKDHGVFRLGEKIDKTTLKMTSHVFLFCINALVLSNINALKH